MTTITRKKRIWLLGAAVSLTTFCIASPRGGAEAAPSMSLQDAVRYALEHSPSMDSARRELENSQLSLRNARAGFLPKLDLSAQSNLDKPLDKKRPGFERGSTLGLNLSENIYDNGETILTHDIAKKSVSLAETTFQEAKAKLALEITKAFYDLGQAQARLAVDQEQQKILVKQLDDITRQYRQGLKPKNDYLRFKSQVQAKKIEIAATQRQATTSRNRLVTLLGLKVGGSETDTLTFAVPKPDVKSIPAMPTGRLDAKKTYLVMTNDVKKAIQELELRRARKEVLPKIDLGTSIKHSEGETDSYLAGYGRNHATTWDVTLSLNYTLWDWGTKRRELQKTVNSQAIETNQRKASELELAATLKQVDFDLKSQRESLDLSREYLAMESSTYAFLEDEYRRGNVSYLDLIEALSKFINAKTQFNQAYYSYLTSLAEYRFYEGTLDGWIAQK